MHDQGNLIRILSLTLLLGASTALPACGDDGSSQTSTDTAATGSDETGTTEGGGSTGSQTEPDPQSTGVEPSSTTGDASTGAAESDDTGSDGTGTERGLEIVGQWVETFPGGGEQTHTITEIDWTTISEFGTAIHHIDSYDNETDTLIAQADASNDFNPEAWGKFQWTWDGNGDLWYCQIVFDAATPQDAAAGPDADPSDPANGGCGGFPWSALTPR